MKNRLLLAAVCCVMAAPSVFGTSVFEYCSGFGNAFGGGVGTATASCGAFSLPGGATLNSVEIWDEADFQFGQTGSNSVTIVFTPASSPDTWTASSVSCTVTGAGSSTANTCGFYSGNQTAPGTTEEIANGPLSGLLGGFTVGEASSVNSGVVSTSSAGVIAEFDYTAAVGSAPEPGSMILLGSGLVAAGLLGRKKFFVRK